MKIKLLYGFIIKKQHFGLSLAEHVELNEEDMTLKYLQLVIDSYVT